MHEYYLRNIFQYFGTELNFMHTTSLACSPDDGSLLLHQVFLKTIQSITTGSLKKKYSSSNFGEIICQIYTKLTLFERGKSNLFW